MKGLPQQLVRRLQDATTIRIVSDNPKSPAIAQSTKRTLKKSSSSTCSLSDRWGKPLEEENFPTCTKESPKLPIRSSSSEKAVSEESFHEHMSWSIGDDSSTCLSSDGDEYGYFDDAAENTR